uniref:Uncharacterized protein n=1 Tax=Micrurus lemniscatus lemniscatus TaxID=129467 RepID=A0A2D4JPN1_MICLE
MKELFMSLDIFRCLLIVDVNLPDTYSFSGMSSLLACQLFERDRVLCDGSCLMEWPTFCKMLDKEKGDSNSKPWKSPAGLWASPFLSAFLNFSGKVLDWVLGDPGLCTLLAVGRFHLDHCP